MRGFCQFFLLTCLVLFGPARAAAEVLQLTTAQAWVQLRDGLPANPVAQTVVLPYGWDYRHGGHAGVARFTLTFDTATYNPRAWALYVPRLGNAYSVTLNGVDIDSQGELTTFDGSDHAKIPRLMTLAAHVLAQHNVLQITLRCDERRRCGLPVVLVGPREDIDPLYHAEYLLRVGGSTLFAAFSLVVALLAVVLWSLPTKPQPGQSARRDPLYLYSAVAELAWACFVGDTLVENPPVAWRYWVIVLNLSLGVWMAALWMLCQHIAGWQRHALARGVRMALAGLLLLTPFVSWGSVVGHWPWMLSAWQLAFGAIFVATMIVFVSQALGPVGRMHKVMAGVFVLNVSVGLHDFYINRIGDIFGNPVWLRYSATSFGVALAVIAITRFRAAQRNVNELLTTLSDRIDAKERALEDSYRQLERSARAEERALERSRILRDMHDGVGSHISTAIRQLETQPVNPKEVLTTLRDSLDQLKLAIDALYVPPGDVGTLLANMRYRLEPRIRSMGLELEWHVEELPMLEQLDSEGMRQLQYLCFEAISNVLQHAHARTLAIHAAPTGTSPRPGIHVTVGDDGRGFQPDTVEQRGLKGMAQRAQALGGQLTIASRPGQTRVEVSLGSVPLAVPA